MFELGQFIKEKREALGLTQKALGEAASLSDAEIHRIETGSRKTPNWNSLCCIAKALDLHPLEILQKAGYITTNDLQPYVSPIKGLEQMNARELRYLQLFADFIISQRDNNSDSD